MRTARLPCHVSAFMASPLPDGCWPMSQPIAFPRPLATKRSDVWLRRAAENTRCMRVVVTGATGNIGTALLRALAADARVQSVVGVARRRPAAAVPKVEWQGAD